MIYLYISLAVFFGIILLNGFFKFELKIYFKLLWSNEGGIPIELVTGHTTGLPGTNQFEKFKYRLRPYIVFRMRQRFYHHYELKKNEHGEIEKIYESRESSFAPFIGKNNIDQIGWEIKENNPHFFDVCCYWPNYNETNPNNNII